MSHVPGRLPVAVLAGHPGGGKTTLLNHLPRDESDRAAFIAEHPGVFEHIFDDAVTLCIWNRQPDPILESYLRESVAHGTWERRAEVDGVAPRFEELLTGFEADVGRIRWETELAGLVELFITLTDAKAVGLRMTATDRATCPRFHSDQVGLRMLCSWVGEGTEWLDEGEVRQLPSFAVGVLKGDLWPGNEGRGVRHRSPQPAGRRVFVSLDAL
jgi:hypothetical protein